MNYYFSDFSRRTPAEFALLKQRTDTCSASGRSYELFHCILPSGCTPQEATLGFCRVAGEYLLYIPSDVVDGASDVSMFLGSFAGMMNNIETVLGNDQRSTNIKLNSYYASAIDLDTSRDSVSGVDLNDEATNLIQYQKAYTAACRLMTTIDEALERLISNTGIVGR